MTSIGKLVLGIVAGTLWSFAAIAGDGVDEIEFKVQSEHPNSVELEFYSQDRNAVWPGRGEVYLLNDYEVRSYPLQCDPGETICYGAWVRGDASSYWGVGPNGKNGCQSCCYICGDTTSVIVLSE